MECRLMFRYVYSCYFFNNEFDIIFFNLCNSLESNRKLNYYLCCSMIVRDI